MKDCQHQYLNVMVPKLCIKEQKKYFLLLDNNHFHWLINAVCLMSLCIWTTCCSSNKSSSSHVNQAPQLNYSDSLAMVNIYNSIGPWGSTWNLKDIRTWSGVEIALDLDTNEYRIVGFEYYGGNFHGYIPEDLGKLTELRKLALCGGTLKGSIPSWIGKLTKLQYLAIAENCIGGKIPEEISKLVNLQYLAIHNNLVCGKLPPSIGKLVNIVRLTICHTKIEGEIPTSLSKMRNALVFNLSDNQLSGRFPIEILTNKRLYVGCENNNITDLPFEVWEDNFIGSIPNLQGNKLSGKLPNAIFQTLKWKKFSSLIANQKEGYGYVNYKR